MTDCLICRHHNDDSKDWDGIEPPNAREAIIYGLSYLSASGLTLEEFTAKLCGTCQRQVILGKKFITNCDNISWD